MTKKDYIKIAKCLKDARAATMGNASELQGIKFVTSNIVDMLLDDNSNFDVDRFLQAVK